MSDFAKLPSRPSLEQIHKQAKDLLKQHRAGDPAALDRFRSVRPNPAGLADAQFVLAREYGFESWAKLVHQIEYLRSAGAEAYERLARDVAAAYTAGDFNAIREMNWHFGTSFTWDRDLSKMQQRLPIWYASSARSPELALADARRIVAHAYGFESWENFVSGAAASPAPPYYHIDWNEGVLMMRGPMSDAGWDEIAAILRDQEISGLHAGDITDDALNRLTRLDHLTRLHIGGSMRLTDDGIARLGRMPQLEVLDIGGPRGMITDRGLEVLRQLPELRRFEMQWQPHVTDKGAANLAFCPKLERVNLMGTAAGDQTLRALAGKPRLSHLTTGTAVTDAGLAVLHDFPVFKSWQDGQIHYGLMEFGSEPNHLLLDGPITDRGIASLVGLDGVFGLGFFWHARAFTGAGLASLKDLPNLGMLHCNGERCDDEAMRSIAGLPRLRMLLAQGTVATDAGFAALARSRSLEYLWGRECPYLTGKGFAAMSSIPTLLGLAVSCRFVDDASLATLPNFPALTSFMPMDVPDEGFLHLGRCPKLEHLWCMYCRDTGDVATEHIAGLNLKTYYAGQTRITDQSLEILARMQSLESLEFWSCGGITDTGVGRLAALPRLRKLSLDGLPAVSRRVVALFPSKVQVSYSG